MDNQQTVTIEVKAYRESRQFEIISKEKLFQIIDDLNASEVYRELCKMHESDRMQNHYASINLENGELEYLSIMNNSSLHPFDDVSIEVMSVSNTTETVFDKMDWIEWFIYSDNLLEYLKDYIKIDSDLESEILENGFNEMKSEIEDLEGFSDFYDFYENHFFDCLENFETDFEDRKSVV